MNTKVLLSVLVLFSLLASCNMPASQTPAAQPPANEPGSMDPNAMATAVELTAVARVTEIAGSAVPGGPAAAVIPTLTPAAASVPVSGSCNPTVTATVNANVRSGPDTAYDVVGSLLQGQTVTIAGRNDAYTWWYIDYPGAAGGHAWISGTVVASACVPSVVQVVAAPPLPTVVVVAVAEENTDNNDNENNNDDEDDNNGDNNQIVVKPNLNGLQVKLASPDLVITGLQISPSPAKMNNALTIKITVKNQGTAASGNFSVQWWSSWAVVGKSLSVASLAAGESKTLSFSYTYNSCSTYDVKAVVDEGNLVKESNEGNNSLGGNLKVKCQ